MRTMLTNFLGMTALVAYLGVATVSWAQSQSDFDHEYDPVNLTSWSFRLDPGDVKTFRLDSWRKVKNVHIVAEGASSRDGTLQVVVNGDIKGTVYVPGRVDPNYWVNVSETTKAIQLIHTNGGSIRVVKVIAYVSRRVVNPLPNGDDVFDDWDVYHPAPVPDHLPVPNQAAAYARRAMRLVDALRGYTRYQEYGEYLLPIKKVAGRAYAVASARGPLSRHTWRHLLLLKQQIEYAHDFLDLTFEQDYAFELAVSLLKLGDEISDALDDNILDGA